MNCNGSSNSSMGNGNINGMMSQMNSLNGMNGGPGNMANMNGPGMQQ